MYSSTVFNESETCPLPVNMSLDSFHSIQEIIVIYSTVEKVKKMLSQERVLQASVYSQRLTNQDLYLQFCVAWSKAKTV